MQIKDKQKHLYLSFEDFNFINNNDMVNYLYFRSKAKHKYINELLKKIERSGEKIKVVIHKGISNKKIKRVLYCLSIKKDENKKEIFYLKIINYNIIKYNLFMLFCVVISFIALICFDIMFGDTNPIGFWISSVLFLIFISILSDIKTE